MFPILSRIMLAGGPATATLIAATMYANQVAAPACWCAWVAITCAIWWIFECLNIAVVGMLPFVVFPAAGVIDESKTAAAFGHPMILLLMGGFFLSAAMQRSGAHRRIALSMVRLVGGSGGKRLVLGFMLATAALSMWISNAATSLMMLPIALAILDQADDRQLQTPLLLGLAYAASVGGMATPIGTPANLIFMGIMEKEFGRQMSFSQWMSFGVPIVVILIPAIWWWITRSIQDTKVIDMPEVGPWRPSEVRVLTIFTLAAVGWVFRQAPYGGWSAWMPAGGEMIGDTTVALAASMLLFLCPAGEALGGVGPAPGDRTTRLLDWETATQIPWGILIMFGGGLALAAGFESTSLSKLIADQLSFLRSAPPWQVVLSICLLVTFMTEITSGTATATLLLPILAAMSVSAGVPPETLMIPGTISASCAFMLPVATAPNVIVFGTGRFRTDEMARNGLMINFFAAGVITLVVLTLT